MDQSLEWQILSPDVLWCEPMKSIFPGLASSLALPLDFRGIAIVAHDSAHEEKCWFAHRAGVASTDPRPFLELFCSHRSFAKPEPVKGTVYPSQEVWESQDELLHGAAVDRGEFSSAQTEKFLFHNLLLAQDLVRRVITPASLPLGQVEAFEAAWEVVVDGRLSRKGLPGYALADRRSQFSKLFSSAGVLMPDHWQIFQSLWDGGLATGKEVVAILRQLPRL